MGMSKYSHPYVRSEFLQIPAFLSFLARELKDLQELPSTRNGFAIACTYVTDQLS